MENLKEMDNFLDKYDLPKLNQDQISKLNRPISAEEIETVIKKSPKQKKSRFQLRILQGFQRRTNINTQIIPHNRNRRNIAKLFL